MMGPVAASLLPDPVVPKSLDNSEDDVELVWLRHQCRAVLAIGR